MTTTGSEVASEKSILLEILKGLQEVWWETFSSELKWTFQFPIQILRSENCRNQRSLISWPYLFQITDKSGPWTLFNWQRSILLLILVASSYEGNKSLLQSFTLLAFVNFNFFFPMQGLKFMIWEHCNYIFMLLLQI